MMGETRECRCLCRKVCSFHCFPVKLKQLFQSTSQTSKQNLQLHMKTTVNSPPSFTHNTHARTHTPERSFCHPDLVYLPRVSYLRDITENVPKRAHNFFLKRSYFSQIHYPVSVDFYKDFRTQQHELHGLCTNITSWQSCYEQPAIPSIYLLILT